jgi:hypothetical protein
MPIVRARKKTENPMIRLIGKGGNSGSKRIWSKNRPVRKVRIGAATKMREYVKTVIHVG